MKFRRALVNSYELPSRSHEVAGVAAAYRAALPDGRRHEEVHGRRHGCELLRAEPRRSGARVCGPRARSRRARSQLLPAQVNLCLCIISSKSTCISSERQRALLMTTYRGSAALILQYTYRAAHSRIMLATYTLYVELAVVVLRLDDEERRLALRVRLARRGLGHVDKSVMA